MFLKGECADFPDSWSDRMWGPDDLPNQRTQYELRRAAVRSRRSPTPRITAASIVSSRASAGIAATRPSN